MRKEVALVVVGLFAIAMIEACGVSPAELPGKYIADYGFARDTVTIVADGTFTQQIELLADGRVETSTGHWRFDEKTRDIFFTEDFLVAADGLGRPVENFAHPRTRAITILPVRKWSGRVQIGVDPGVPYKRQD